MKGHFRSPDKLLRELGILEPKQIDLEAIAQYCGATIMYEPLQGCAARILAFGDRAIITLDSNSLRSRQRFSAGHELGHWMHDRGKVGGYACTEANLIEEWGHENREKRANEYSADLLLPAFMFVPDARNRPATFQTVRCLARRYKASLTATAIRLVELGSFPAMIICNSLKRPRWKWFRRGADIHRRVWPLDIPGKHTIAHELLSGALHAETPADVAASEWFDLPEADRYVVHEDSIKIRDNLVLTMLWWKDEKLLLELEDGEE